ncbi:MAG: hypothetical protein J6O88_08225 [Chryseobacterium sp.]|uniref:hypothetical protein n=1 Tax=Chryseobacterium sp. TaxID=1871047 RepID=UPI001B1B81A0|nr:hypothetical protein [Chryseobacterium sp.]MBO6184667.1 hypothetical protein [Chryseobacterium sp.]
MDKNIRKQLKTDYEDLEIKPSANLWKQIESGLGNNSETVQKTLFQWWKYAAVIIIMLSFGSLFYFNSNQKSNSKKTIAAKKVLENKLKPKDVVETTVSNENIIKNPAFTEVKTTEEINKWNSVLEMLSEKTEIPKNLVIIEKEINNIEAPQIIIEKFENPLAKPLITEKKKVSYISGHDLLLARELDKTREENNKDQRKFGVFDMSKIKGPSSLKIFGLSVISDSLESK